MYVTDFHVALEVAAGGYLLAVLPDRLVQIDPRRSGLRRLPVEAIPPTMFYAVRRLALVPGGLAETVIATVRRHLSGLALDLAAGKKVVRC
jgi:DNA-binding transcriptional LysR family regulator